MKPTQEQKLWLQDYLYQAMAYRETYEEVYDHILLAVENKPVQHFFETTVNDIIDEDFGGSNNMLSMEDDCKYMVEVEVKAQYWRNVLGWFQFPLIIGTAAIFLAVYYLISYHIVIATAFILLIGLFLPVILISVRSFKMGRVSGDTKTSIRDSVFRWLIYGFFLINIIILRPVFLLIDTIFIHVFHYQTKANFYNSNIGHCWSTIGFMIIIIHFLSLVKLYKDEFNTGMHSAIS